MFRHLYILIIFFNLKAEAIETGKAIYEKKCLNCHGINGLGDGPASRAMKKKPRNFKEAKFLYGSSDEELFKTISKGIDGSLMPAWEEELTEKERWSVLEYIKNFHQK